MNCIWCGEGVKATKTGFCKECNTCNRFADATVEAIRESQGLPTLYYKGKRVETSKEEDKKIKELMKKAMEENFIRLLYGDNYRSNPLYTGERKPIKGSNYDNLFVEDCAYMDDDGKCAICGHIEKDCICVYVDGKIWS